MDGNRCERCSRDNPSWLLEGHDGVRHWLCDEHLFAFAAQVARTPAERAAEANGRDRLAASVQAQLGVVGDRLGEHHRKLGDIEGRLKKLEAK